MCCKNIFFFIILKYLNTIHISVNVIFGYLRIVGGNGLEHNHAVSSALIDGLDLIRVNFFIWENISALIEV